MKKVRILIILIYIFSILMISTFLGFKIVKNVEKGTNLYFKFTPESDLKIPLTEKDLEELIEILKNLKII
jgi:hypothetical protein